MFITFEGGEGAGKSTQIKLLADFFKKLDMPVVVTREPGGTKISERIRDILLDPQNAEMARVTEALLYAASRAQLTDEVIKPSLEAGNVVICDRFLDSSLVYQGHSRGLGIKTVMEMNLTATSGILPDITFFLDVPPEVGFERKSQGKNLDRMERLGLSFHKEIYFAYKELCRSYPERIRTIDGTKLKEEVFIDIVTVIRQRL